MCCDGTWNTPDQLKGGEPAPTNVTKLALAVLPEAPGGKQQKTSYHRGVGTRRRERIRGGALGFGLSRDVCDVYRSLVQSFEPGDDIFFFGFSRGAFIARSTAGLVRNAGILRPEHADRIDEAYALYRNRSKSTHPSGFEATLFRSSYSRETRIRFIGVWDTVGALGIPLSGLRSVNLLNRRWQFHDTTLSTTVDSAYQALAIDEKRGPFRPAIWQQAADVEGQQLEQVWFAGVHSDVGGGYTESALSDIALLWLVERAQACDLAFNPSSLVPYQPWDDATVWMPQKHVNPDPLGELHESRRGIYRLLPPFSRAIGEDGGNEHIASSVIERTRHKAYMPPNLRAYFNLRRCRDDEVGHVGCNCQIKEISWQGGP
jgi:uncharacterized protein (DUF2235 family)